jgi:hypothetical protein
MMTWNQQERKSQDRDARRSIVGGLIRRKFIVCNIRASDEQSKELLLASDED